jgi:pimeloyl-ACP methyl ester carboxylesterase
VADLSHRLHRARPDASLELLEGVGHHPMVEAPDRFEAGVGRALLA